MDGFSSSINLGLPQVSRIQEEPAREEMQDVYAAFRIMQLEIDKLKARLAAAGIP